MQVMQTATPEEADEIRDTLARLPMPHPGYHLRLQRQQQEASIDLWELCYQVCFLEYSPNKEGADIDTSLIDELGEVDWLRLDAKARELVDQTFTKLPEG